MSSKGYVDLERGTSGGPNKLIVEAFGTCFMALALFGLDYSSAIGALAVGVMLALMTWLGGGHCNPAVTAAYSYNDKSDLKSAAIMIGAQIGGAVVASVYANTLGGGSSTPDDADNLITTTAVEVLFVIQLVLTYASSNDALIVGLSYFAGLLAYGGAATSTANPALVLGVVLGNVLTGGGFSVSTAAIVRCIVPLVAGALASTVIDFVKSKVPRSGECLGTFYLVLGLAGIGSAGGDGAGLAIAATLATWIVICGNGEALNPTITVARLVKDGKYSTWADPVLDILAQTIGAMLAVIMASWAIGGGNALAAKDLGNATIIDILASLALAFTYFKGANALDTGLVWFGLLVAFGSSAGSVFNPAIPLGGYIAGVLPIDLTTTIALPIAPIVGPLVGGALAGFTISSIPPIANEAIGTFFVYLAVAATNDTVFGSLATGAVLLAFTKIYGADLNPVVTFAREGMKGMQTIGLQVAGATAAGFFATWYGGLDGCTSDAFDLKATSVELIASILLAKVYSTTTDAQAVGISYAALLITFGGAMGSVANPAVVVGQYAGSGLLNISFDLSTDGLTTLLAHVATPLLGAFLCAPVFALVESGELGKVLHQAKGFLAPRELFGSFFLLLAFGAVGEDAFSRGVSLILLLHVYSSEDLIPTITIARILRGENVDYIDLGKRLTAQTVGALIGLYAAAWLVGAGGMGSLTGQSTQAATVGGLLLGATLSMGWCARKGALATGLIFFLATSLFSGPLNPAFILAGVIQSAIGGDVSVSLDLAVGILAPLAGGAVGGIASSYLK